MNLRQKAKHYKRLYEQYSYKTITPVVFNTSSLQQHKVVEVLSFPEQVDHAMISRTMAGTIADKLVPLIEQKMETRSDKIYADYKEVTGTFNFWCEGSK